MKVVESNNDKKRNEILSLAKNELLSCSIASFSLNIFLTKAHISKGSFYHHFKNRDDLIFSVLEEESRIYRIKLEDEIYKQSSLKAKFSLIFEAYYEDSAKNRWIAECYKELFIYAITSGNERARRHFENIKDDTLYLINQSIETSNLSKAKKIIALNLSEFLSIGIDSFFVNYEYFFTKNFDKDSLWQEQRDKILSFIENICLLLESNSHIDSRH